MINIQSISDIITNSSSEVFVIYTKEGIETLKEIISGIFHKNFDEHFDLKLECNDRHYYDYERRKREEANLSFEEWCLEHSEGGSKRDEIPSLLGVSIIAKHPEDEEVVALLNKLPYIFETMSIYC